jgi:hypothetical protein
MVMFRLADYPLTVSATLIGLVVGSFVGVSTDNLSAAFAAFCLFASIGWTWRKGDPPVLPFILTYQWVSVTAGYWYLQGFDSFPGIYRPGDVEYTMFLALAGLLVLALGIRIASQATSRASAQPAAAPAGPAPAMVRILFCVVMVSYGLDYVYTVNARDFGGLSSFVQRILEFRQILLVTLWLEIIRSRKYLPLLLISFAWTVVPRLGSYYSDFKSPVILMLIVLAAGWRPWEAGTVKRSFVAGLKAAPFVAALVIVLLVWQGSLKKNTRLAYDDGSLGRDAFDRIGFFVQNFRAELPQLFDTPEPYVEALVERVSYITFFSRVLEHVPDREPYAEGELLRMAMSNAFVPRVLVPEKPELPSDSYYTRRFTGIPVAEAGTSVSIGYMAEFYSDWGLGGMYASILLFGAWIGFIGNLVRRLTAVPALRFAVVTTVLLGVADFEQQFIKGFAALNLNVIVTLVLVFALKPWLQRLTGTQPAAGDRRSPAAVAEAPVR